MAKYIQVRNENSVQEFGASFLEVKALAQPNDELYLIVYPDTPFGEDMSNARERFIGVARFSTIQDYYAAYDAIV